VNPDDTPKEIKKERKRKRNNSICIKERKEINKLHSIASIIPPPSVACSRVRGVCQKPVLVQCLGVVSLVDAWADGLSPLHALTVPRNGSTPVGRVLVVDDVVVENVEDVAEVVGVAVSVQSDRRPRVCVVLA
jgi:hypothetical protein